MISPSAPEPACDIEAQIAAVLNPAHPKDAVWIARGTPLPGSIMGALSGCSLPDGMLLTSEPLKAIMLQARPTDETLAVVLGYLEPKWACSHPVVVRALDDDGCVITEMAVSPDLAGKAYHLMKTHGTPEITTIDAALERRRILVASETNARSTI